jgi:hypothetical protein
MAVTLINETKHAGDFVATEAVGRRSRDTVTILSGQNLGVGRVCGKVVEGTATGSKISGTGNGTVGAVTLGQNAQVGTYVLTVTAASANAGTFSVVAPDGERLPDLTVGVAYASSHINLTIADGSADWVVGDVVNVVVAAGSGKWVAVAPAAVDGSQFAAGVLFNAVDATGGDKTGVMMTRACELNRSRMDFGSLNNTQIATAIAQLAALGIIVRAAV